jgi:hypothetical protein
MRIDFLYLSASIECFRLPRNTRILSGQEDGGIFRMNVLTSETNEEKRDYEFLIAKQGSEINGPWQFLNTHNGYHFFWLLR